MGYNGHPGSGLQRSLIRLSPPMGTGILTRRHHMNRDYFIIKINPWMKGMGLQIMFHEEWNYGWYLKRPAFVKHHILSSKATLTKRALPPAHLATVVYSSIRDPRDGSCGGAWGSLHIDWTWEAHTLRLFQGFPAGKKTTGLLGRLQETFHSPMPGTLWKWHVSSICPMEVIPDILREQLCG